MKKYYILLIAIVTMLLLIGCNFSIPNFPNEEYDETNTILAYIMVFPAEVEMTINQSQKFEVKAYNSDNKIIAMDVSEVKWVAVYQCLSCGKVWKLSPTQNSLQTTFTPLKTGKYKVWANYQGEWAKAVITIK